MLRVGDRIGEWVIEGPLGEGGMGAVYRAHSALSARVDAALKVLKPTGDASARARFVREAEALAALRHPAIVRVMGFSEDVSRGLLYLVMELAEGPTLRDRLAAGALSPAEALGVFTPLASALAHAHDAGVVHRDVKPANVVLTRHGPRLVDFGIATTADLATLTSSGHLGTLGYMAPETFRGEPGDPKAADVYAFGLVLHECLTGARVFPAEGSPAAVAASISVRKLQAGPLDPGQPCPERLRELVREATDPRPGARPAMADVNARLVALVERRGAAAAEVARLAPRPTPFAEATVHVPEPVIRRSAPWPWLAGGAVLLVLAAAAAAWVARERAAAPRERTARTASSPRPRRSSVAPPSAPAASVHPSPPASPSPAATPAATVPSPPAAEPPASAVLLPAEPLPLTGRWRLENVVEDTNHPAFRGLRLDYVVHLRETDGVVRGHGHKVAENGERLPRAAQSPLRVHGTRHGHVVELEFEEEGAERTTGGSFFWRLSGDGQRLEGRFASAAAASAGPSVARRD